MKTYNPKDVKLVVDGVTLEGYASVDFTTNYTHLTDKPVIRTGSTCTMSVRPIMNRKQKRVLLRVFGRGVRIKSRRLRKRFNLFLSHIRKVDVKLHSEIETMILQVIIRMNNDPDAVARTYLGNIPLSV